MSSDLSILRSDQLKPEQTGEKAGWSGKFSDKTPDNIELHITKIIRERAVKLAIEWFEQYLKK